MLDKGKFVGVGFYKEFLKENEIYCEIYDI